MTKRKTALYCRTAHKSENGVSIQKERLSHFAEENGYGNLSWYTEEGYSVVDLNNRPAMTQLISDIQAGTVDTVIMVRYDRIARDLVIISKWLQQLKETDVKCVSLEYFDSDFQSEFVELMQYFDKH